MNPKGMLSCLLFAALLSSATAQTSQPTLAAGNAKQTVSATPAVVAKSAPVKVEKKTKSVYSVFRFQFDEKGFVVMAEPDIRFQEQAKVALEKAKVNGSESQFEILQTILNGNTDLASLLNAYAELGYELEQIIQPGLADAKTFTLIFSTGD